MSDEKVKNENRKVEWSFDFGQFTESFNKMVENFAGDEELVISEFDVPKQGVESARVNVHFSVAQGFVKALPAGDASLFKATIHHVGELDFTDEGDAEKKITLKQKQKMELSVNPFKQGLRAFANRDDLMWDIQVSPDVPLNLNVDGGVGPTKLDLTGLQLHNLKVDTGVGTLDVIFPTQEDSIVASVDGGVGQTKIYVPDNADLTLDIDAGVGAIEVIVPPNSALQVKGDGGIGAVKVPKSLNRIGKNDFMEMGGVWQSEGFELAKRRIIIRYDGGVGEFKVTEAEII